MAARWKPDYVIPTFPGLWVPNPMFLPCGWGVERVDVGPELAFAFLDVLEESQRNRKPHIIACLRGDMKAGRYVPTHQAVAFNRIGRYCDGQNRAEAIFESGVTVSLLVWFGIGGAAEMAVMDTGASRSAADAGKVMGIDLKGWRVAATRQYLYWHNSAKYRGRPVSNQELISAAGAVAGELDRVGKWFTGCKAQGTDRAPVRAAVLAATLAGYAPPVLERFAGVLVGTLPATEPGDTAADALKYYIQKHVRGGGTATDADLFLRTANAICKAASGERVTRCHSVSENPFRVAGRDLFN